MEGKQGARRSLGGRALACKGLDHLIDPAWWIHLLFGLFSIPTSGPSKAVVCAVLSGKVHVKDPLLLIGNGSLYGNSRFPLKKYVTITIYA